MFLVLVPSFDCPFAVAVSRGDDSISLRESSDYDQIGLLKKAHAHCKIQTPVQMMKFFPLSFTSVSVSVNGGLDCESEGLGKGSVYQKCIGTL